MMDADVFGWWDKKVNFIDQEIKKDNMLNYSLFMTYMQTPRSIVIEIN